MTKHIESPVEEISLEGGFYVVEVIRDRGHGPEVIQRVEGHNIVLNSGKKQLWRMSSGMSTKAWRWFQLGHNSASPSSTDTGVKTAITSSIKTASTLTMSGRTFQAIVSYPSGGGSLSASNIKEFALNNTLTSASHTSLCRALVTPVVSKTTADKLKISYQVRIA
jgi:hypothetical protein